MRWSVGGSVLLRELLVGVFLDRLFKHLSHVVLGGEGEGKEGTSEEEAGNDGSFQMGVSL